MKPIFQQLIADIAPLWVGGMAILQIYVLRWTLPLEGERYEWAQYLLLGTAFPILVLLTRISLQFQALLALACFIPVPLFLGPGWHICALLGVGQLLLLLPFLHLRVGAERLPLVFPVTPSGVTIAIAVACLSWLIVSHWVFWSAFPGWLVGSAYIRAVALGAFLLSTTAGAGLFMPRDDVSPRFSSPTIVPVLLVFAWLSAHVCGLGMRDLPGGDVGLTAYHHWGAIVESSDLVRQGAWPLWEIPTQYGFLNTLLLASLPLPSVWQSMYVCNAVLMTISAGIVFWIMRSLRAGPLHYIFSLLCTIAAVFLIPGDVANLTGPFPYPSVGAYRFIWCYVLLGILVWDYGREGSDGKTLWLGSMAWLAGTLWSAESAVFCATMWVPCCFLLALRRSFQTVPGPRRWRERLPRLAAWLALPPLMLAIAIGIICGIYAIGLGHLPEVRCFFEYSMALDFFAMPINPAGAVGVLLLAFIVIATTGAYCLRADDTLESLPLVVGSAAMLWAVSSYFVGRSHDNNVTNLTPVVLASVAAVLRVLDRFNPREMWCTWLRVSLLPVFTVLLVMAFFNEDALKRYVDDAAAGYRPDVTLLLPDADSSLEELLREARVDADTPLAFFDNSTYPSPCPRWHALGIKEPQVGTHAWLPTASTVLYVPLSAERRHVYFERFIARTQLSGWLIRPNADPRPDLAWVLEEVAKTHTPGRTLSNARWTMTWYECR